MYIADLQGLPLSVYFKKKKKQIYEVFPFNAEKVYYFYYARNGIYQIGRKLLELGHKEMLFPAYNHGNEIRALRAAGIELNYFNIRADGYIDFEDLENQIRKTNIKVLYVIHYIGFPQNIEKLLELKEKYGLILIEDAALALFSKYKDKFLGEFGDVAIFCLYKFLPIPTGGCVVVNNDKLDIDGTGLVRPDKLSTLSQLIGRHLDWLNTNYNGLGEKLSGFKQKLGRLIFRFTKEETEPVFGSGFDLKKVNWAMSPISFFILDRLDPDHIISRRRKNFALLAGLLNGPVKSLYNDLDAGVCPWFYPAMVKDRKIVFETMKSRNIEGAQFWRVAHDDIDAGRFKDVERLRREVIELVIHQDLSEKHIRFLARQFEEILSGQNSQPDGNTSAE